MHISSNQIRTFIYKILIKEKVNEFSANAVADGLVHASLRGVDSHGIRLLPHYFDSAISGRKNPKPKFEISKKILSK